jgi:hypothetical protein
MVYGTKKRTTKIVSRKADMAAGGTQRYTRLGLRL